MSLVAAKSKMLILIIKVKAMHKILCQCYLELLHLDEEEEIFVDERISLLFSMFEEIFIEIEQSILPRVKRSTLP